jgi:hypothetical protein
MLKRKKDIVRYLFSLIFLNECKLNLQWFWHIGLVYEELELLIDFVFCFWRSKMSSERDMELYSTVVVGNVPLICCHNVKGKIKIHEWGFPRSKQLFLFQGEPMTCTTPFDLLREDQAGLKN